MHVHRLSSFRSGVSEPASFIEASPVKAGISGAAGISNGSTAVFPHVKGCAIPIFRAEAFESFGQGFEMFLSHLLSSFRSLGAVR